MCGIAGVWGKTNDDTMDAMLKKIKHRGPDEQDRAMRDQYTIGHNRLSIIDIQGGRQPISNEDDSLKLIFNGEIYNHQTIKKSLPEHTFKTKTDSEAIIHLYEQKGKDAVRDLDGMFAFALCSEDDIFMARDPLGIKPLYYGYKDQDLYFSSEIKSLLHATRGVREFPAGHYYSKKTGLKRYYSLPEIPAAFKQDIHRIVAITKKRLERAVTKRLMSDAPLGVFLSGGLDSSMVSSIARKHTCGKLHSFSVGTADSADIFYSKKMAKILGTEHHVYHYGPKEIIKVLPEVIYYLESYDAALVRSAIPTYFVSKMAKDYVKVVLSGEGADELFGGYHYLKTVNKTSSMLHDELLHITENLHNTNLQRADRMTMAHSIEARVPFLDTSVIGAAMDISPALKIYADTNGGKMIEKWILRRVAESYLPKDFIWRKKEKFAVGSGTAQVLEAHARAVISDKEFEKRHNFPEANIRSKEDMLYFNIFRHYYGAEKVLSTVGRSRSLNPGVIN